MTSVVTSYRCHTRQADSEISIHALICPSYHHDCSSSDLPINTSHPGVYTSYHNGGDQAHPTKIPASPLVLKVRQSALSSLFLDSNAIHSFNALNNGYSPHWGERDGRHHGPPTYIFPWWFSSRDSTKTVKELNQDNSQNIQPRDFRKQSWRQGT